MVKIITGLFFLNTILQSNMEFCRTLFRTEGIQNAQPHLSKDGERVLYQSNATGKWQLMIFNQLTNTHTELTNNHFNNYDADWSLNNEWVSFVSDRDGNEELYLMKSNGTELKRLTNDKARDVNPYFSPDNKYILFNSTRGNGSLDIYRYTIKTSTIERITNTKENETFARYSPDMKKIVYLKNDEKTDDVFLLNTLTNQSENITNTPDEADSWPMFNKTGEWIYFSSVKNGAQCIFKMKPNGSNVTQITYPSDDLEENSRVYISHDEKTMLFNKKVGKTLEVWGCTLDPS